MRLRLFGIGLLALALVLAWPYPPERAAGGWENAQPPGGRGPFPGFALTRGIWSRIAPSPKPSRGAPAEDPARLTPLDSLRDAPSSSTTAHDPASYWAALLTPPLRSARTNPSRPSAPPTVTVQRASQPSARPSRRLPTVRSPSAVAANPTVPFQNPRLTGEPRRSAPGGARGTGALEGGAAPRRRTAGDFDGRKAGDGGSGRLTRPSTTPVPSWQPAERKKDPAGKPPKPPKPPTLNDWLGRGTLKAPNRRLKAPSFTPLRPLFPERLPDGRPYDRASPPPAVAESLIPPDERPAYQDWLDADERRRRGSKPHWHQDGKDWLLHAGKAWGAAKDGRWSWLLEYERRWWTVADGAQRLVRHGEAWWWNTKDGWFLLKGGEPWAWRRFPEWEGHGFIHPTRGTQVVYSADGARLAVITPGQETVVFDAATGEVLAKFPPAARPGDPSPLAPLLEDVEN